MKVEVRSSALPALQRHRAASLLRPTLEISVRLFDEKLMFQVQSAKKRAHQSQPLFLLPMKNIMMSKSVMQPHETCIVIIWHRGCFHLLAQSKMCCVRWVSPIYVSCSTIREVSILGILQYMNLRKSTYLFIFRILTQSFFPTFSIKKIWTKSIWL